MLLRLMTYNILEGGKNREQFILETIRTNQPDLIILQEVDRPALLDEYAAELGMYFYYAPARLQIVKGGIWVKFARRSLGLLSRFPIVAQFNYHPLPIWRTLLEASVEYAPGQRLTLWGVHLKADLMLPNELWRSLEVSAVLKRATKHRQEKYLMAGDFNTLGKFDRAATNGFPRWMNLTLALQGGKIYRFAIPKIVSAGFVDCYRTLHPEEDGFTLPTPDPNTRLDYIFASPSLAASLRRCEVITEPSVVHKASDHYPLIAEFEL